MKTIDLDVARKSTQNHALAYKADSLDNALKIGENDFLPLVLAGCYLAKFLHC